MSSGVGIGYTGGLGPSAPPGAPIAQYLTPDGLGTPADIDAILDYSPGGAVGPTEFKIGPAAGATWRLNRCFISVSTTGNFSKANDYVTVSALTNGIELTIQDAGGLKYQLDGGVPVTYLAGWNAQCFDETNPTGFGAGDNFRVWRWTFGRDVAGGFLLDGDDGDYLSFLMQDDLTGRAIVTHRFLVKGEVA